MHTFLHLSRKRAMSRARREIESANQSRRRQSSRSGSPLIGLASSRLSLAHSTGSPAEDRREKRPVSRASSSCCCSEGATSSSLQLQLLLRLVGLDLAHHCADGRVDSIDAARELPRSFPTVRSIVRPKSSVVDLLCTARSLPTPDLTRKPRLASVCLAL